MRALALGLASALLGALLAAPTLAGEAEEQLLHHWGECAVVGALWEIYADEAGDDPTVARTLASFKDLEPRMEAYANGLADSIGEDRANAVQADLLDNFDTKLNEWTKAEDKAQFLIDTWSPTMDRCIREAATLPTVAAPTT